LKYLPVFAVLVAVVIGVLFGKELYPTSGDLQHKTLTQSLTVPNSLQPQFVLGGEAACGFSNIYLSFPPKCKTLDGKFIPLPGPFPYEFLPPEGK